MNVLLIFSSSTVDCKFNCHKRCAAKIPRDCLGEVDFNGGEFTVPVYTHNTPVVLTVTLYFYSKTKSNIAPHSASVHLDLYILHFKFGDIFTSKEQTEAALLYDLIKRNMSPEFHHLDKPI